METPGQAICESDGTTVDAMCARCCIGPVRCMALCNLAFCDSCFPHAADNLTKLIKVHESNGYANNSTRIAREQIRKKYGCN